MSKSKEILSVSLNNSVFSLLRSKRMNRSQIATMSQIATGRQSPTRRRSRVKSRQLGTTRRTKVLSANGFQAPFAISLFLLGAPFGRVFTWVTLSFFSIGYPSVLRTPVSLVGAPRRLCPVQVGFLIRKGFAQSKPHRVLEKGARGAPGSSAREDPFRVLAHPLR